MNVKPENLRVRTTPTNNTTRTPRTATTRIAHLSDIHLLARSQPSSRIRMDDNLRMRFASFGRPLDAMERQNKLARAIDAGREAGASVFILTGDLTEIGLPEQFEALAEVLHESGVDPKAFVLVPGNHDAYTRADAFQRALGGALAPFSFGAATSRGNTTKLVDYGDVLIAPLDVTVHQPVTKSAGELHHHEAAALDRLIARAAPSRISTIAALHHHPFPHRWRAWQWVDGLRGWEHLHALLGRHSRLHALHGHLHYPVDRPKIFGATATVEDDSNEPRVRLYDVCEATGDSTGLLPLVHQRNVEDVCLEKAA